jgi:Tol biopolymer transport system component
MTRHITAAVAALTAALLAVPAIRHWRERPPEPPPPPQPLRAAWVPAEGAEIGAGSDYVFGLALAPDGRRLVYPAAKAGVATLWLHDLRSGDTRALPGTERAAAPFWSADGTRVGFFADSHLRVVELSNGTASSLADAPSPRGGTWNAAGDIVFAGAANSGLTRRHVDGSIAPLTTIDAAAGETSHGWPAFLADGTHLVFLVTANDRSRAGIWITSMDEPSSRRRLTAADSQPLVPLAPPQALNPSSPHPLTSPQADIVLFLTDQVLVAHALDVEAQSLEGRSMPVGLSVGRGPLGQTFASAGADVLIFGAPATPLRELRWVSGDGTTIGRASEPVDAWDLRLAPDGRRVAVTEVDPQLRTLDVFIRSGSQPVGLRLSLSTDADESGVWSPDGLRIAWVSRRRSVMIRGAGAVLPEQTIATFDSPIQVWDWSRDGRSLLIGRTNTDTRDDLWIQPAREGEAAQPYVTTAFNQTYGVISPDGRWAAYASDESGKFDIYVDAFPKPGSRVRVTTAGGTEPRWAHDGEELYFRRGSEIHVTTLRRTSGARGVLSVPSVAEVSGLNRLFDAGAPVRSYDVSPDGRFLLNVPAEMQTQSAITLIHHWRSVFASTPRRDKE